MSKFKYLYILYEYNAIKGLKGRMSKSDDGEVTLGSLIMCAWLQSLGLALGFYKAQEWKDTYLVVPFPALV